MASTAPVDPVSPPAPEASSSETPLYTLDTLKEHATRESMWMLLHDKVYDITAFMDEHPGGDEVLLEEAGKDATEAFEDVGHSDEARAMLPKMLLGEFSGPKKTPKVKKSTTTAAGTKSSSGFPLWVIPVALVGAFLAWRVYLA